MSQPLVTAREVGVRHDGRAEQRPSAASFELRAGEVTLLLGPSGSGKSTLALALNGLVPHALPAELTGSVEVGAGADRVGTLDAPVPDLARRVAMVLQDPDAALTSGTVLDEVCFGPENLLVPIAEVMERAERALRTVGLWHRRTERPERLSGGGRQRLAIAGALAMRTPVLVLDEPTANLDPVGSAEVLDAIRAVAAEGDRAILLVEHDLDGCIDLVDRVLVLDRSGRLVIDGPARATLAGRADELAALGVWLPRATIAAMALRDAGTVIDPLPLRPAELARAMDALDRLPEPVAPSAATAAAPRPESALITVSGLTVRRRDRVLLHDVDLRVDAGEFVAIVGVNGAGKTTLLQAIGGVVAPPRGTVSVDGLDPGRARPRELVDRIGSVFQNPEHQFVTATVFDELAHGLRRRRVDEAEITTRVDELLERFALGDLRDAHPFTLSGGQKRRLSVGTALITGPRILALDEPTFGQDRERADELVALLSGLHADGTTVLVVTHDLQLVADAATRIVVLADGRIVADGPTEQILAGDALETAGLLPPPIAVAMRSLQRHPSWRSITRMAQIPRAVDVGAVPA